MMWITSVQNLPSHTSRPNVRWFRSNISRSVWRESEGDPGEAARVTVSLRDGRVEIFDIVEDQFKVEIERFSTWVRNSGHDVVHRELTEQNLAVRLAAHESLASGLPAAVRAVQPVEHHRLLQEQ